MMARYVVRLQDKPCHPAATLSQSGCIINWSWFNVYYLILQPRVAYFDRRQLSVDGQKRRSH